MELHTALSVLVCVCVRACIVADETYCAAEGFDHYEEYCCNCMVCAHSSIRKNRTGTLAFCTFAPWILCVMEQKPSSPVALRHVRPLTSREGAQVARFNWPDFEAEACKQCRARASSATNGVEDSQARRSGPS